MISSYTWYILAYNGETYNVSFRNKLISIRLSIVKCDRLRNNLYLYVHYGIDKMLELLNGMFAFIIVDLKGKSYMVRDHRN